MSDTTENVATYERAEDAGKPPRGIVTRWCKEIELADRVEKPWREKGDEVLERYRDEKQKAKGEQKGRKLGTKFNILRPNTRVMKAAIYQKPPKPDVRRRFKDKDPLGKAVSEVTERALSFCMDEYDFDGCMSKAVKDQLLPGRGLTRVRYEPETIPQVGADKKPMTGQDGQPMEQIQWEKVCFKHVNWKDFRHGPGRTWEEVTWRAFRWRLTRDEAIKEIPESKALLETIDLDCQMDLTDEDEKAVKDNPSLKDVFKRLTVWEVWDKNKREVLFIAPSYKDKPLTVRKDPLGLKDFFDCPVPLYDDPQTDTLEPVENFRAYADQAKELDNITARIDGIVAALKVRGLYNSVLKGLKDVMQADENTLLPADEVSAIANMGGLENNIWLMPIEKIAAVLKYLYEQREQTKQIIYEITGLSDILRGASKASETATAQSIKAQNGAMSIQDKRQEVERYGRDLVRLAAEIICEHFQPETLKAMTGSDYPTEQEKQQLQMELQNIQMQMAAVPPAPVDPAAPQQAPAGPPPELMAKVEQIQDRLAMPSWEQIIEVMRSDALRSYRIDVETDETAFGDQAAEQEAVTQLMSGIVEFMNGMAPMVMSGAVPPEFVKALLGVAVRRFKTGREIEDAIEELGEGPMPQPVDPNAGKLDIEKQKLEQGQAQHDQKMAFEQQRHDAEMARAAKQDDFNERNAGEERQSRERMAELKSRPPVNVMLGKDGGASVTEDGGSVAALGDILKQMMAMSAQAEARQSAAIAAMGEAIGQAIVTAATLDRVPERGKDGKIKRIKVVAPKEGAMQ